LRLRPGWVVAAAVAVVGDLFLHQPITDLLALLVARIGHVRYERAAVVLFSALAVVAVAVLARRRSLALAALLLVGVALVVQKTLLVATIENIHYPQYALLAVLLGRAGLGAEASWLAATGLGAADEMYQWLWMPRRATFDYLDWNDVFLNALGAAFGVIALRLWRPCAEAPVVRTAVSASTVAAGLVIGWLAGPPRGPVFRLTETGIRYHVMSAAEGVALVGLTWLGVRLLIARSTVKET
jgi:hypothetical protein